MPSAELKLNIGCGTSGLPGWVNIDNSPTILLSRLPFGKRLFRTPDWARDVRRIDVRKRIPFDDSSVSYIYSSHTFEHFSYDEALAVSRECFRVLKTGGILRVVVPDLSIAVREYLAETNDPKASQYFVERLSLTSSFRDLLHPGSNHKQMFDSRSLVHLLREAGFLAPEVSAFGRSRIPDISSVDLEVRRAESLYVECVR
jgi:predicted SAM-dependent methyltransferase